MKRILRFFKFAWQRKTRGFDDSETWNLDNTIANFVLPRLKRYKELNNGCPILDGFDESLDENNDKMHEEWNRIIDRIIFSLERISKDDESDWIKYPENYDHGWTTKPSITHPNHSELVWNDKRKPEYIEYEKLQKEIQEGLSLFSKYFRSLWW